MRLRRSAVLIVTAVAVLLPAAAASAAYPAGVTGHDISYPQCTSGGASTTTVGGTGGAFGIVGVTGGRPFGPNSCSLAEFNWAAGLAQAPGLYMNTANPAPTSSYYWPTSGSSDPAACTNSTSTTDSGCAYDYGWHAAADALGSEAKAIPNAASYGWWLDVESANSWNGNGMSNAADLQGSIDYLRSHGVPSVGLYSTSSQWTTITGGYTASTAASYASAWAPEFTASYPMTSSPVWVAGLGTQSNASANCGTSFTGGPTWLAQYADRSGVDADLSCSQPATTAPGAPSGLTATGGNGSVALSWTAPTSTGGGSLSYDVYRGLTAGGESTTPLATGVTSTGYTDTAVSSGTTYYYTVTAVNSVGSSPVSNEASATPTAPPPAPALSFNPSSLSLTAGQAGQLVIDLSSPAPSTGLSVTVTTNSTGGTFTVGTSSSTGSVTLSVPAGGTASSPFTYSDTKSGSPTLTASTNGWTSASEPVTVTAGTLARVRVTPNPATVFTRHSQTFTAAGADAYGNPVSISPTWSLSSSNLGTLSCTDRCTSTTFTAGTTAQSGTVTASQGTVSGTATVTVTAKGKH